jgi:hypothetical protein
MKHTTILMSILAIAACGGKKSAPVQPKDPDSDPAPMAEKKPAPEPAPEQPAPPPPPKSWHAQAELTPVKGAKLKAATVTFSQDEGHPVTVASTGWFDGIKVGKYHLIVHEAAECGPNATKVGKPMPGDIPFAAAKGATSLDVGQVESIQLDGDSAIVGRTLVLHDDKKGKPGKALACGPIASAAAE